MVAGWPDETGVSPNIRLIMTENIFAFNTGPEVGTPTGIYLGQNVELISEGYNLFWSREDGEIQADFLSGQTWFSQLDIREGAWSHLSGGGTGDLSADPQFFSSWPQPDLHLKPGSPALDSGSLEDTLTVDLDCMARPGGPSSDIGAFEMNSVPSDQCSNNTIRKSKKIRIRR